MRAVTLGGRGRTNSKASSDRKAQRYDSPSTCLPADVREVSLNLGQSSIFEVRPADRSHGQRRFRGSFVASPPER